MWKDQYGKVTGARIDLVCNRVCPQYFNTGFHAWLGDCQRLHVCKQFLEGSCDGKCRRSHNFFDEFNRERTKRFGLDNFPNKLIRRIVCYSFPQVCLLYLKSKCTSDDCPYLHICASVVGQKRCDCPLLHNNVDLSSHNKKILERHGLFLEHSKGITDYALRNILVPVEQKHFKAIENSFEAITCKMTCSESLSELDDKPTRLTLSAKRDRGVKFVEHQKRKQMYPTTGRPSAMQDPKSILQLVSEADVPSNPNSHSVDKGNEEIEPNQQQKKVPPQASKSISKIPRKEAVVENQKNDKTFPRTLKSSPSQVAKSIPGVVSVTDDILSHPKSSHSLDKRREGVEVNQNKEKSQSSKIGSRMALKGPKRVSKINPELHSSHNLLSIDNEREAVDGRQKKNKKTPNSLESSLTSHDSQATPERLKIQSGRDVCSHRNSHSIENGQATVKGNQKIETTSSTCSNSSFTLHVSKSIPGIPSVTDDVPGHPNPHSSKGQQKNDKTPPSSPGSSLTPRVSKDIRGITRVTVDVPSHPDPYSINKGDEADEPNQKDEKIPLSSSNSSSTSQVSKSIPEIRDVTENVLTYPNPNSVGKGKETSEGLQENENKFPTSSDSSLNLPQVSESIPGITGVAVGVPGPNPHSIKEKEAIKLNQKNQKIPLRYLESRLSSQDSKSILGMPGVIVAGRSHPNPHSIDKGKAAVNPNQRNEKIPSSSGKPNQKNKKMPPSSSDSTFTSQVFKSVPGIPGNVSSYPNPNSVDKGKEEGEEQQKNEKTPLISSDSSLTSQVSKPIPSTLGVIVGVPGHPNPLFINKGNDAIKPNQTNKKTRPSSSDSSLTSQVSTNIPGMPGVTCGRPSHPNPLSINKRKGAFEPNQKNEKMPPGSLNCSLTSHVSKTIPGILGVTVDGLSYPNSLFIDKGIETAEGQQTNEKTSPSSSDSSLNSQFSKTISYITFVPVGGPNHSNPHSIMEAKEAVKPNQKNVKKPPSNLDSSLTSQVCNNIHGIRDVADNVPREPNPHSTENRKEAAEGQLRNEERPPRTSDGSLTSQFSRSIPGETRDVPSYLKPHSIDKGKAEAKGQQKNEKTPSSSSGSSLTSQVSKYIPGILDVTVDAPGHPSPLSINKGKEAVEPNQKNKKIPPSSSGSSSTSRVSKSIPGIPHLIVNVPSYPNTHSIDKGKEEGDEQHKNEKIPPSCSDGRLASEVSKSVSSNPSLHSIDKKKAQAEGQQESEKTPPSFSESSLNSHVSKDIPGITGVTFGGPSNPDQNDISKEKEAVKPNQKNEKTPPGASDSSFSSQVSSNVSGKLSERDDILSHPNPLSSETRTQNLPQGCKGEESPLKESDSQKPEERRRYVKIGRVSAQLLS